MKRSIIILSVFTCLFMITMIAGFKSEGKESEKIDSTVTASEYLSQTKPQFETEFVESIPSTQMTENTERQTTEKQTTEPQLTITSKAAIKYAMDHLNVRAKPNGNAASLGTVSFNSTVNQTGICNNGWTQIKYKGKTGYVKTKYLASNKCVIPKCLKTDGNVSLYLIRLASDYYYRVPSNVRKAFERDGWTLIITTKNIARSIVPELNMNYIMALTRTGPKKIYVEAKEDSIRRGMMHEFGHYVDYKSGWINSQPEFKNIFAKEQYKLIEVGRKSQYNIKDSREYFAEVFDQAILFPSTCKSSAPESYDFVLKCSKTIK